MPGTETRRTPAEAVAYAVAAGYMSRADVSRVAIEFLEDAIKNPLWKMTPKARRHGRGPN